MSHGHVITFEGKQYRFPADATDEEISQQLASISDESKQLPFTPPEPSSVRAHETGIGPTLEQWKNNLTHAMEGGKSPSAVQFVGGPLLGPLNAAHGLTTIPSHPVKGLNETVRGIGQTVALPMAVANPGFMAEALPYAAAQQGIQHGAEYLGADEDTSELAGNLAMFGWGARRPITRTAGELLKSVAKSPDLPTDIPRMPMTSALTRAVNTGKSKVGGLGRRMSNVGIPQAPDVLPNPILDGAPEPVDTTVRPDAQSHYNDIADPEPAPAQGGVGRIPIWQQAEEFDKHIDAAVDPVDMYHGTHSNLVSSIRDKGLQPAREYPNKSYGDDPARVHMFDNPTDAASVAAEFGPQGRVIKAQVPRGLVSPHPDPEAFPGRYTSDKVIHSDLIKDVFDVPGAASENPREPGQGLREYHRVDPNSAYNKGQKSGAPQVQAQSMIPEGGSDRPMTDMVQPSPAPRSAVTPAESSGIAPTPASNTLLRAIQSASGWPDNGIADAPWDQHLGPNLDTDPYNRVDELQAEQSRQPHRRLTDSIIDPGQGEIVEPDAFDDYDEKDIFRPDYKSNVRDDLVIDGQPSRPELPPGPEPQTVGSQSGADADTAAFNRARQELPDGTLSDHLRRAQEIKDGKP